MNLFGKKESTFQYKGATAFWDEIEKDYLIIEGVIIIGRALSRAEAKDAIDRFIESQNRGY